MSRTLESLIRDKKYKNYNIKVGSISGSSFWLCKKNHSGLSADIQKEYNKCQKRQIKALNSAIERLNNLDELYEKRITEQIKKGIKDTQGYRQKQYRLKELERKQLPRKIGQLKYDIATPFLERHIKATYNGISPDEKPCLIIYITGCEKGDYWTVKEYERKGR